MGRLHAEQTFDSTDDAANRRANDGPDRAGDPPSFTRTMRHAAGHALSLRCERRRDRCRDYACKQYLEPHAYPLFFEREDFRHQWNEALPRRSCGIAQFVVCAMRFREECGRIVTRWNFFCRFDGKYEPAAAAIEGAHFALTVG